MKIEIVEELKEISKELYDKDINLFCEAMDVAIDLSIDINIQFPKCRYKYNRKLKKLYNKIIEYKLSE